MAQGFQERRSFSGRYRRRNVFKTGVVLMTIRKLQWRRKAFKEGVVFKASLMRSASKKGVEFNALPKAQCCEGCCCFQGNTKALLKVKGFQERSCFQGNTKTLVNMKGFKRRRCFQDTTGGQRWGKVKPKGGRGCLMYPPCLKSQGCHLIPLHYLLSCSSDESCYSFCLFFCPLADSPDFFPENFSVFFVKR